MIVYLFVWVMSIAYGRNFRWVSCFRCSLFGNFVGFWGFGVWFLICACLVCFWFLFVLSLAFWVLVFCFVVCGFDLICGNLWTWYSGGFFC